MEKKVEKKESIPEMPKGNEDKEHLEVKKEFPMPTHEVDKDIFLAALGLVRVVKIQQDQSTNKKTDQK